MPFLNHKSILFFITLTLIGTSISSLSAFGSSGPPKETEEKKREDNGYDKKLTKVNTYQSEIKSLKASIADSITELKHIPKTDPNHKLVLEQIVIFHEDLELAIENFNRVANELRHKFPEKSDSARREYLPYREESLEEVEKELDLDDLLTEVGDVVYRKYKSLTKKGDARVRLLKKVEKKKKDRQKNIEVVF